jgi:hypothetical protein
VEETFPVAQCNELLAALRELRIWLDRERD